MFDSFFSSISSASPATIILIGLCTVLFLYELWKRLFLTFNDNVPTKFSLTFFTRPPADRIGDMHDYDKEVVNKMGTPVMRYVAVQKPWSRSILIGDPAVLKAIYTSADWEKFDRGHHSQEAQQGHAGGLILMKNGQKWRDAREHLGTKTFSTVTLRTYVPILREQAAIFLDQLEKRRKANNGNVDLQELYNNLTFDVICRLTFGESSNAQTTEEGARYLKAWDGVLGLSNIITLVRGFANKTALMLIPGIVKQWEQDKAIIENLIRRNLARVQKGEDPDRVSILDDFARNPKVPDWLKEEKAIVQQLMTVLFGGHDTTAALLSFITYEMATHPEWQQKAREEVLAAFGTPKETEMITNLDKLESLQVLNACLKETLRMYPSAPYGAGRVMNSDLLLHYTDTETGKPAQLDLRKGDQILPSMYIAQMYQPYWDEKYGPVSEWSPRRFIEDINGGAVSMFCHSPFGNGARRCAGERLALAEGRLMMAELLRRYEWKMREPSDFKVLFTGTLKAKSGVNVVLSPIKA